MKRLQFPLLIQGKGQVLQFLVQIKSPGVTMLMENLQLMNHWKMTPEVSVPEASVQSTSQAIDPNDNGALLRRIAELEAKSEADDRAKKHLEEENKVFKRLFNPDQVKKLTGSIQKGTWSDKTLTEAIQTRFLLRETGYEHLREKFPGAYPATRTLIK